MGQSYQSTEIQKNRKREKRMSASKRIYKKKMFQTKQYGKETRNRKPEIYCCCCILRAWPSSASHFSIFFFSLFLLWPVQDAQQLWFVVFPSFLKNQIERKKTSTFLPALQHEREREKGNLSCIIYPGRWSRRERKKKAFFFFLYYQATHTLDDCNTHQTFGGGGGGGGGGVASRTDRSRFITVKCRIPASKKALLTGCQQQQPQAFTWAKVETGEVLFILLLSKKTTTTTDPHTRRRRSVY
jgi:hypothetical protein